MADFTEYRALATKTESRINYVLVDLVALKGFLEAFVAVGNILDSYKKNIFYGREINSEKINDYANKATHALTSAVREFNNDPQDQHPPQMVHMDPRAFHAMIGLCTESVELAEAIVKVIDGNVLDAVNVQEEFFDALWYILIGHDAMNKDLESTLEMGFNKLKLRYADKFSSEAAINRDVDAERALMEQHQNQ